MKKDQKFIVGCELHWVAKLFIIKFTETIEILKYLTEISISQQ